MFITTLLATTAKDVFTYIGYVLIAILALMVMIIVHESGHYLAGKIFKFDIDEFSVGFGPAIFKHRNKKNGELFAIRCIPLGGYCAFYGEDSEDEDTSIETDSFSLYSEVDQMNMKKRVCFNSQKPWKRLIVLFSGAFFNFLFAIFVIAIYFSAYGQFLPKITATSQLEHQAIVFEEGDVVLNVNGKQVNILLQEDLDKTFSNLGDTATFKVLRNGKVVKFTATKDYHIPFDDADVVTYIDGNEVEEFPFTELVAHLTPDGNYHTIICKDSEGYQLAARLRYEDASSGNVSTSGYYSYGFGITRGLTIQKLSFGLALGRSFGFSFFVVFKILATLGALITGKLGASAVGGTITTVKIIAEGTKLGGFSYLMYIMAIVSANLAVFNLLPIPALDGSRMVFTGIEWVARKPVPRKIEAIIHTVGLVVLVLIAVFFDVFHLITGT